MSQTIIKGDGFEYIVTESENLVYVDVDSTLCFKTDEIYFNKENPTIIKANYYGQDRYIRPHQENIAFLKTLKARGNWVIIHSANGNKWAREVIEKFQLQPFINEVKSKPIKYVDDKDVAEWFGARVYLQEGSKE